MIGLFNDLVGVFGFDRYTSIIAAVSLTALLGCLCGGIAGSVLRAYSGSIRPTGLFGKTSFRLIVVLEVMLIGFAAYYHTLMVGRLETGQIIFWVFTLLALPVLGVIGSQIGYLLFRQKIDANIKSGMAGQHGAKRSA